ATRWRWFAESRPRAPRRPPSRGGNLVWGANNLLARGTPLAGREPRLGCKQPLARGTPRGEWSRCVGCTSVVNRLDVLSVTAGHPVDVRVDRHEPTRRLLPTVAPVRAFAFSAPTPPAARYPGSAIRSASHAGFARSTAGAVGLPAHADDAPDPRARVASGTIVAPGVPRARQA